MNKTDLETKYYNKKDVNVKIGGLKENYKIYCD